MKGYFKFQLRHDMIDQKEGETELNIKVHYDDMVSSDFTMLVPFSFMKCFPWRELFQVSY